MTFHFKDLHVIVMRDACHCPCRPRDAATCKSEHVNGGQSLYIAHNTYSLTLNRGKPHVKRATSCICSKGRQQTRDIAY